MGSSLAAQTIGHEEQCKEVTQEPPGPLLRVFVAHRHVSEQPAIIPRHEERGHSTSVQYIRRAACDKRCLSTPLSLEPYKTT